MWQAIPDYIVACDSERGCTWLCWWPSVKGKNYGLNANQVGFRTLKYGAQVGSSYNIIIIYRMFHKVVFDFFYWRPTKSLHGAVRLLLPRSLIQKPYAQVPKMTSVLFMRALKSSFFNKFFLLIFFFCNACCETNVGYCSLMSPSHPPPLPGKVLYLTLFYSFPCFFSFLSSKWISCLHMYIYEYIHLLVFTCGQWECSSSIFLLTTSQILQQERGDEGQQGTLIIPAVRAICIPLVPFRSC